MEQKDKLIEQNSELVAQKEAIIRQLSNGFAQ
jgi:hypothetical protein